MSLAEQEEQASWIFEERRLAIQQERQALDDSREYFLATLTTHPAMASRPIVRNDLEIRDFLGRVGANEVRPIAVSYCIISRCLATPPSDGRRNQISIPTRSVVMAILAERSADHPLEDVEVKSLQQYNRRPPRRARKGRSLLWARIAECQDPSRCPDLEAGGRVERDQGPCQREVPHFVALSCHEEEFGVHRRLGLDPRVGSTVRQEVLSSLEGKVSRVVVTRDNFAAMMEDHLRRRGSLWRLLAFRLASR